MQFLADIQPSALTDLFYVLLWAFMGLIVALAVLLFFVRWWQWRQSQPTRPRGQPPTPNVDAWAESARRLRIEDQDTP